MFIDKYTKFYYNNICSSSLGVVITNNHDLQMNLSPSFSDKFVSTTYGQTRYYEGTTVEAQNFVLNCVAINVDKTQWGAITRWLSPLSSGPLTFDWNRNHYYMVKLTKATSGEMWVKGKKDKVLEDKYNVSFQITFTTIGDWAALGSGAIVRVKDENNPNNVNIKTAENFKNNYGVPFIIDLENKTNYAVGWIGEDKKNIEVWYSDLEEKIFISGPAFLGDNSFAPTTIATSSQRFAIINPGSRDMYLNLYCTVKGEFSISQNNETIVGFQTSNSTSSRIASYNGRNGYLTTGGRFVQDSGNFLADKTTTQTFSIKSGSPEIIKGYCIKAENKTFTFKIGDEFVNPRSRGYIVSVFETMPTTTNIFNIDEWDDKEYYNDSFKAKVLIAPKITIESGPNEDYGEGTYLTLETYDTNVSQVSYDGTIDKDKLYYISICDLEIIEYTGSPSELTFEFQTRDVL